ncbi:NnrS family protein, partial [Azospirillum sp.]|uniref:NnrS family protein n=1 Tax=Azospirillum sp. TaxID=34012 RepID=UPI002D72453E
MTSCPTVRHPPALMTVLGDEGLRLFFPLAALHAALWPFLWVVVHGFQLPFAGALPPGLWHAHELIFGSYGAALIGFIT